MHISAASPQIVHYRNAIVAKCVPNQYSLSSTLQLNGLHDTEKKCLVRIRMQFDLMRFDSFVLSSNDGPKGKMRRKTFSITAY